MIHRGPFQPLTILWFCDWVVQLTRLRDRMPSRRTWTSWRSGPTWTSWGSTRPRAGFLKDMVVQVFEKLDITWPCVLAAQKANHILGCIKRSVASSFRGEFCPAIPLWWEPTWSPASSCGALNTGKTWTCWNASRGGPQKWSEGWNTSPVRKVWGGWDCSAWRWKGCGET